MLEKLYIAAEYSVDIIGLLLGQIYRKCRERCVFLDFLYLE